MAYFYPGWLTSAPVAYFFLFLIPRLELLRPPAAAFFLFGTGLDFTDLRRIF
jgi:hypothetical protein